MERKKCKNCGHEISWFVRGHYLEGICYHCLTWATPVDIGDAFVKSEGKGVIA